MDRHSRSSYRPKSRDIKGIRKSADKKIKSSIRRKDFSESKLRKKEDRLEVPTKKDKSQKRIKDNDDGQQGKIDQDDIRKTMKELESNNDNLIFSFCQNEDDETHIRTEIRETTTRNKMEKIKEKENEDDKDLKDANDSETEKPKSKSKPDKEKNIMGKLKENLKQKKISELLKKTEYKNLKYSMKQNLEKIVLILGQKYILSYHNRVRKEREHEKHKKTIQKQNYEQRLNEMKKSFQKSEGNIQELWESRLARNEVTKFTTRVDFKFIDTKLKKIEKILNEKEFSMAVVDKTKKAEQNLKDKIEENMNFFQEFQKKFKDARLKLVDIDN